MSNYTSENLIQVAPQNVPAGTLLIKIGDDVFTAGAINIDEYGTAYVAVSDSGTIKAQRLAFDGTQPSDSGAPQSIQNVMIFQTGHPEPVTPTPAASINFYKCTAVQTSQSTWTGRLVDISESTGIWTFQSTSTTGLQYSWLTPVVDHVYDESCTFMVTNYKTNMPSNGLVFYAPFSSLSAAAQTGQTLEYASTRISFSTQDGVPCAKATSNGAWSVRVSDVSSLPMGSTPCTMSIWLKLANTWNSGKDGMLGYGGQSSGSYRQIGIGPDGGFKAYIGYTQAYANYLNPTDWHNICAVFDGTNVSLYLDGVLGATSQFSINTSSGVLDFINNRYSDVYFAAARIYNRVLSNIEIVTLASQFTPTV